MNGENENQYEPQLTQQQSPPPGGGHPYGGPAVKPDSRRKSVVLATLLSSFPGLGQVYVGYYQTGFLFMAIMAGTIFILSSRSGDELGPLLGPFLAFFWIFNMIDAHRRAQHFNRVLEGGGIEEIPDNFQIGGGKGSVPAGAILVAVGILIFLDLNFGVSLAWVQDWWPMALVAGGVWLIYKARSGD